MPKLKKRIKNKLINKRIYIIYKNYNFKINIK